MICFRKVSLIAVTFILASCSHSPVSVGTNIVGPVSDSDYYPTLERYTKEEKKYSGFHNTFQAKITWLNSEVQTLALQRRGHFLQWDLDKSRQEREKMFQEMSSTATVFLAFFAPENDYDDLNKPKSIWKIYLEHDGNRYEGKIKKATEKYVELKELYPYLERFHTPYYVEFQIPMTAVESHTAKVILTSSLGSAEFIFPERR